MVTYLNQAIYRVQYRVSGQWFFLRNDVAPEVTSPSVQRFTFADAKEQCLRGGEKHGAPFRVVDRNGAVIFYY